MGNDESKQKTADFRHPVSPKILQAVTDTGGVTDGSIIPLLKDLSPLEMRIKLTVQKWRPAYSALEEARRRAGSKRQRKKEVDAIVNAERVLTFWLPWLSGDGVISGDVISLINKGELSDWLKRWPSKLGRRSELILAGCAEDLEKVFKQFGRRKSPWEEIGQAIATGIPEAQAYKSDSGNWIYQLVKRHRQGLLKINSRRVGQRNTKVSKLRKRNLQLFNLAPKTDTATTRVR
jgi:hypothetical protein